MIDFFNQIVVKVLVFLFTFGTFFIGAGIYSWWMIRLPMKYLHFLDKVLPLLYLGGSAWMWYKLWQFTDGEFSSLWDVFRQKLFDVADDVHDYVQHLRHFSAPGSIWLHTREIIISIVTTNLLFFPLFYLWKLRAAPRNLIAVLTAPLHGKRWFDITLLLYLCIRLNDSKEFSPIVTFVLLLVIVLRVMLAFVERKKQKSA